MITGGGGGNLETAGPIKPYFQNNVKHGHHYVLVAINGRTLEFKAFDMEGRLFDYMKIDKSTAPVVDVSAETAAKQRHPSASPKFGFRISAGFWHTFSGTRSRCRKRRRGTFEKDWRKSATGCVI